MPLDPIPTRYLSNGLGELLPPAEHRLTEPNFQIDPSEYGVAESNDSSAKAGSGGLGNPISLNNSDVVMQGS